MVSALGIAPHRFWVGLNTSLPLRDHCLIRTRYPAPSGGAEYITTVGWQEANPAPGSGSIFIDPEPNSDLDGS